MPGDEEISTSTPRRALSWRWTIVIVVVTFLVAGGMRLARSLVSRYALPTHGAQWIWAPATVADHGPAAFYAVRDFSLPFRPRQAELLLLADRDYIAWINGEEVAAGRYRAGDRLKFIRVAGLLTQGKNRMVVRLASDEGLGGLIASLTVRGEGRKMHIRTDHSWRILARHQRGLLAHKEPLHGTVAPRVWADPPTGRWGYPRIGPPLPVLSSLASSSSLVSPATTFFRTADGWRPLASGRSTVAHPWLLFDWGRPVTGGLWLELSRRERAEGLVWFGTGVPDPESRSADEEVIAVPRRRVWQSAEMRRFRYALVGVRGGVAGAGVWELDARRARPWLYVPRGIRGVFGLEPPLSRPTAENEIWSRLKGFPGPRSRETR
ncbi:MAG TPA: hypothetical protein VKA53_00820 [Thermoanaerobaculia bacterium]|nr:hypothetical protein [Thermoanaerobaculia bacterium]